jgi:hypothetical protein
MKERCVMCGYETNYDFSTHVDLRYGYVEGMGQLCNSCYTGSSRKQFTVDFRTVMDTPNDAELGEKIRRMYYESAEIAPPMQWESIDIYENETPKNIRIY